MTVIDAHVHLFSPSQRERREELTARDETFAEMYGDPKAKMAALQELERAMDEGGLDGAVACGFAFAAERDLAEQNRYLLSAKGMSGGRVAVLATVNPALSGWERTAEAALAGGARGFGELRPRSQGWDPLGPAGHALCSFADEHGAVLLWHVSEPVGHAYAGKTGGVAPAELIELATAHQGVRMVAAHLGGGLSFYLQMPEVRQAIGNIYFDTAAVSLLYDEASITRLVEIAGERRVLFASDYPLLSPRRQLGRVRAVLDEKAAREVCGGNAGSLFFHSPPRRGASAD